MAAWHLPSCTDASMPRAKALSVVSAILCLPVLALNNDGLFLAAIALVASWCDGHSKLIEVEESFDEERGWPPTPHDRR